MENLPDSYEFIKFWIDAKILTFHPTVTIWGCPPNKHRSISAFLGLEKIRARKQHILVFLCVHFCFFFHRFSCIPYQKSEASFRSKTRQHFASRKKSPHSRLNVASQKHYFLISHSNGKAVNNLLWDIRDHWMTSIGFNGNNFLPCNFIAYWQLTSTSNWNLFSYWQLPAPSNCN